MAANGREIKVSLLGDESSYKRAFGAATKETEKFGDKVKGHASGALKGLGIVAGGVAVGGLALLSKGFMDGAHDLIAHEKLMAQTSAVIKSTGGGAGVTAKHVDTLADSIEKMSGMDGDAVQKGENMLLTFTNIRNGVGQNSKVFDQATKTLADMSQAMGTDPQKAAIGLGKALNDPVKGITALSKVGVSFTLQQKEQIKTLVDGTNKTDALALAYPGLTQQAQHASVAMFKHGETVQEVAQHLGIKLTPAMTKMFDKMTEGGHTMAAQKIILGELSKEFGGSAAAAGTTMAGQVNILKAHLSDLEQEIAAKVLPILNRLVAWAIEHWPEFEHYARIAMDAISDAWNNVLHPVIDAIITAIGAAVGVVQSHWDAISQIFSGVFTVIEGIVNVFIGIFTGDWGRAWDGVKQIVSGAWTEIKGEFNLIGPDLLAAAKAIGGKILTGLKDGIVGIITAGTGWVGDLVTAFVGLHITLLNAAKDLGGKIWDGIKGEVSSIAGDVAGFVNDIPGKLLDLVKAAGDAGGKIGGAIADGITGAFTGIAGTVEGLVKAALNKAIGLLDSGFNAIHDHWPDIPGAPGPPFGHDPIPKLAAGGIVTRPTIALIGEAGPEAVIPLGRGGMGAGVHIANIDMRGTGGDPGAFSRRLAWEMRLAGAGF